MLNPKCIFRFYLMISPTHQLVTNAIIFFDKITHFNISNASLTIKKDQHGGQLSKVVAERAPRNM